MWPSTCSNSLPSGKTDKIRPSYVLTQIASFLTWLAQCVGRAAAYVSSFVEYVKGEMFYVPLFKLGRASRDLARR